MLGFPSGGINYNSPIIQSMGGMRVIPPSPMGNIAQFGSMGYNDPFASMMNSPYYTGFVYQSPFEVARRQEAMKKAQKEQMRKESDTLKAISKGVHKSLGDIEGEELEKHIKQFDPIEDNYELETMINDIKEHLSWYRMVPCRPNMNYIAYCQSIQKQYKEKYPDDMSLAEFLEVGGELYRDSLFEMKEREARNGQLKYDSNKFNSIVDMHRSSSSYFNKSLLRGGNIDVGNLEIQLPEINGEKIKIIPNKPSMQSEYEERRRLFIQACLNGGKTSA